MRVLLLLAAAVGVCEGFRALPARSHASHLRTRPARLSMSSMGPGAYEAELEAAAAQVPSSETGSTEETQKKKKKKLTEAEKKKRSEAKRRAEMAKRRAEERQGSSYTQSMKAARPQQQYAPSTGPKFPSFKQIIPFVAGGIATFFAGRTGKRMYGRRQDSLVLNYGSEMASIVRVLEGERLIEEMTQCHKDYIFRAGPGKLKKRFFLEFCKEMIDSCTLRVSKVQALGHALSLYGLSEKKAAEWLVEVTRAFPVKTGTGSRAQLLLLAERVFTSPEGLYAIEPMRDLAAAGRPGGNELVDVQLAALREKAYRDLVLALPEKKRAEGPPPGGDVLGLTAERVGQIYEEVMADGDPDYVRYAAKQKESEYAKQEELKAQLLAVDGLTVEDVLKEEQSKEGGSSGGGSAPGSKTFECQNCGYTLFVAAGREEKFFPQSFTCPTCGSPRDKFTQK